MANSARRFTKPTPEQKRVLDSMRAGHRAELQFSAFTGRFAGYVRIYDPVRQEELLVPWYRIKAMIERSFVKLDGTTIEASLEIVLVGV